MIANVDERRSFGYDLYSLLGTELADEALLMLSLSRSELPWSLVALACFRGSRAAARSALTLRTMSEQTGRKISRDLGARGIFGANRLYDFLGVLVHHRKIEVVVDPPLKRRAEHSTPGLVEAQSLHRLTGLRAESDRTQVEVSFSAFADAVVNEVDFQMHTDEGKDLRRKAWEMKRRHG